MVVCMRNAPQALAFGHLATSWGHCLGEFRRHGLARGSISLCDIVHAISASLCVEGFSFENMTSRFSASATTYLFSTIVIDSRPFGNVSLQIVFSYTSCLVYDVFLQNRSVTNALPRHA